MNMTKYKCTTNSMQYAHHSVSNQNPKSKSNPKSQALIDITNKDTMEAPPPRSIDGIRARRTGGKKGPKKYRKYHRSPKSKQQQGMPGFSKGFAYIAKGLRGAFEALR